MDKTENYFFILSKRKNTGKIYPATCKVRPHFLEKVRNKNVCVSCFVQMGILT